MRSRSHPWGDSGGRLWLGPGTRCLLSCAHHAAHVSRVLALGVGMPDQRQGLVRCRSFRTQARDAAAQPCLGVAGVSRPKMSVPGGPEC